MEDFIMPRLVLVSHHLCPYVQRAAIGLIEKQVPFERIYVDLSDKPDWFRAVSPLGKVPLLKVGGADRPDAVIFESSVILEYLEETQPRPMHPSDPVERARHRAWIEYASSCLNDIWRFYSAEGPEALAAEAGKLAKKFRRLDDGLGDGPWFGGAGFSLVDAAFAPVFRYFDAFENLGDFAILDGLPKIAAWRARLAARPSVQAAAADDFEDRLMAFLAGRRSELSRRMAA